MIHPLLKIILQLEFPPLLVSVCRQWVSFIVQMRGEGRIKTIDFGKINFPVYFVAYKDLPRFDKINVSQNTVFCRNRTFTRLRPLGWPLDLRVSLNRIGFLPEKKTF